MSEWKKYPENIPKEEKEYLTIYHHEGAANSEITELFWNGDNWDLLFEKSVKFFCEMPEEKTLLDNKIVYEKLEYILKDARDRLWNCSLYLDKEPFIKDEIEKLIEKIERLEKIHYEYLEKISR